MDSRKNIPQKPVPKKRKGKKKREVFSWKIFFVLLFGFFIILIVGIQIKRYIQGDGFGLSPVSEKPNNKRYKSLDVEVPLGYSTVGIDVSKHQGKINWKEVKAMKTEGISIGFAFIKATEGVTKMDPKFEYNWEESKSVGMIRGAYHFFIPWRSAQEQADNFMTRVDLEPGDLPPVIDFEYKRKNMNINTLKKLCLIFEKRYGKPPIIYTNFHLYNTYLKGSDFEKDYYLWIASYDYSSAIGNDLIKDKKFLIWQFSEKARINGINGRVDLNVFNQKLISIQELLIGR